MMNRSSSSSAWKRLTRSNSLLLGSELATSGSEFARVTSSSYQRLSQSVRLSNDGYGGYKPIRTRKHLAWTCLGKVLSFKRMGGRGQPVAEAATKPPEVEVGAQVVKNKKKKKRSSWLPDPDRRWPVQGW